MTSNELPLSTSFMIDIKFEPLKDEIASIRAGLQNFFDIILSTLNRKCDLKYTTFRDIIICHVLIDKIIISPNL